MPLTLGSCKHSSFSLSSGNAPKVRFLHLEHVLLFSLLVDNLGFLGLVILVGDKGQHQQDEEEAQGGPSLARSHKAWAVD